MLLRPEALMGIFRRLPDRERAMALEALQESVFEQGSDSARAYRASYAKVGEGPGYTMQHSLTIYLMGPDGRFRAALAHDLGPQRSAEVIRRSMARG